MAIHSIHGVLVMLSRDIERNPGPHRVKTKALRQRTALVAVVLVLGCAHTPKTSSAPGTGVIAGRVTDDHGVPLQYGDVAVKDLGSDYVRVQGKSYVGSTGPDGKYWI